MKIFKFICIWFILFSLMSGYLILSVPTVSADGNLQGFNYINVDQYSAWVTTYVGSGTETVVIPAYYEGRYLSELRPAAFLATGELIKRLEIPFCLTIGANAIKDHNVETLIIGNHTTTINYDAFLRNYLRHVSIGVNVTTIGPLVFGSQQGTTPTAYYFWGNVAPTVDPTWVNEIKAGSLGHALEGSNFPAPGQLFYGLLMGDYIHVPIIPPDPIVVPPIVHISTDFSDIVRLTIPLMIIIMPAALIGVFVGRFGFVIMLSLMMAIYLVIDPIVLPTAIIVWTQAAIMFYRGG